MGFTITGTGGRDCTGGAQATCDAQALVEAAGRSEDGLQASATYVVTGLSAGSHTFALTYRSGVGVATYANKNLIVMPLP